MGRQEQYFLPTIPFTYVAEVLLMVIYEDVDRLRDGFGVWIASHKEIVVQFLQKIPASCIAWKKLNPIDFCDFLGL